MTDPISALDHLASIAKEQEQAQTRTVDELEAAKDAVSDALYAMEDIDEDEPIYLYLSELQSIVQNQITSFEKGTVDETPDDAILAIINDVEAYVEERRASS